MKRMKFPARGGAEPESASAYRCTSFGHQPPPIWHCQDCEMLLPWPMRPAQDLLSAYQDVEAPLYMAEKDNRYHTVRKVVEALGPTRGRTVLDVGAHCGYFLDVAREAGFRPEGLERSRWAVGHARSQGLMVHGVPLASRGVQYVVTLWVEWLTTLALGVVVAFAAVHLGRLASRRGTWAGSWRTRTATSPSIASRNAGRRRLVRRPGLGGRVGDGERQPLQPSAELEQAPEHAQPVQTGDDFGAAEVHPQLDVQQPALLAQHVQQWAQPGGADELHAALRVVEVQAEVGVRQCDEDAPLQVTVEVAHHAASGHEDARAGNRVHVVAGGTGGQFHESVELLGADGAGRVQEGEPGSAGRSVAPAQPDGGALALVARRGHVGEAEGAPCAQRAGPGPPPRRHAAGWRARGRCRRPPR
jgi:hypothetical protein